MPSGSIRVSKPLTNVAVQYTNDMSIWNQVMPTVPVKNESDLYWVFTRDFKLPDTNRANGTPANQVTWDASTSSYVASEHAIKDCVTDRDMNNADDVFSLEADAVQNLTQDINLRTEKATADLLFTTTTFSNNASLNTATSFLGNTTTSNPVQIVLSATTSILQNAGVMANTVVLGWGPFTALKENADGIHERIKYVERSIVTEDLLASLFDVDKVLVGKMSIDTAQDGLTQTTGFVWGDKCLVAYFEPFQRRTKSAGAIFRVNKKGNPFRVKSWRDENIEGNWYEVQTMFVPKAVATQSAYLLSSVTAS